MSTFPSSFPTFHDSDRCLPLGHLQTPYHHNPNLSYFAAYEVTKKALTPAGSSPADLNLQAIIIAGGTAGVAMWAIAIPPDVSVKLVLPSNARSRVSIQSRS
jgi:hypothetical protein